MGKKIALVCIRILAIGQTPLVQFGLMFGMLGAYTLGQFSLQPFRDSHSNFLHCLLQLALLLFCFGGLLRKMATYEDVHQREYTEVLSVRMCPYACMCMHGCGACILVHTPPQIQPIHDWPWCYPVSVLTTSPENPWNLF